MKLIHGDCLSEMKKMDDNSIDFIVTDPPYGLHFMGKTWDKFKKTNFDEKGDYKYLENASVNGNNRKVRKIGSANHESGAYDPKRDDEFQEFMRLVGIEMLRVIKPGGMLAMFGSPRRHHRQMSGLEDAGFEIRDCIPWIFGQGFPKSHNFGRKLGNEWNSYGTALKPAYEPIIIAMKPIDGTFAQNAEKWGVGGINIDDSRVQTRPRETHSDGNHTGNNKIYGKIGEGFQGNGANARWPANIIFDEEAAEELDRMTGVSKSAKGKCNSTKVNPLLAESKGMHTPGRKMEWEGFGDSGGASRFFYCAKASSNERNKGLDKPCSHPTVKPLSLMKYIITLLAPPGNPLLLDPFMGSGSTLLAAKELGISAIGIEKEEEYIQIARQRIESTKINNQLDLFENQPEEDTCLE